MKEQKINAVMDEDIEKVIANLGILEEFKGGQFICSKCGVLISLTNVQIIIPLGNDKYDFICNNMECIKKL